jgi:tRNA(Ile)-lysidine synthase
MQETADWPDDVLLEHLAKGLEKVAPDQRIGLAISGGPDSMALMHLAARLGRKPVPLVLTVNHGARPEAAQEVEFVRNQAQALGMQALILADPSAKKPKSDRQAYYRDLRYRLMARAYQEYGLGGLCIAHHQDDQAETFLIRLGRGSGVDGLASMAPDQTMGGMRLLRPLLDIPRAALRAYIARHNIPFIRDPSNEDDSYLRVRIRQRADDLSQIGLTQARLASTARAMGRARQALEEMAADLAANCVVQDGFGTLRLNQNYLTQAPLELQLRVLSLIIRFMSDLPPPRLDAIERLQAQMSAGLLGDGRTLGGCHWRQNGASVSICRECKAIDPNHLIVPPGQRLLFDHRFWIRLELSAPGPVTILAAGDHWPKLRHDHSRALGDLPARIGRGLPVTVSPSGQITPLVGIDHGILGLVCTLRPFDPMELIPNAAWD